MQEIVQKQIKKQKQRQQKVDEVYSIQEKYAMDEEPETSENQG
jgi:hypothetical protein